jgi:hypothetical protein
MRQTVRCVLTVAWFSAFNAVVAIPQEQIDRSRDPSAQALLMPQPKRVNLLVIGDNGVPLSQVHIEHANLKDELVTDLKGMVGFNTSAPYFVLSRPGYESMRLATEDAADYRAVLHKLVSGEQFRVCSDAEQSSRVPGWNGIFQVPNSKTTKAGEEKLDADYFARGVGVKLRSKRVWVEQGRGPLWGGVPDDSDVWKATRYRGATYKLGELRIVDAKVWLPDAKCKRSVGLWSESIIYYGLDCDSAQPVDELMDQACVTPDASKHLLP